MTLKSTAARETSRKTLNDIGTLRGFLSRTSIYVELSRLEEENFRNRVSWQDSSDFYVYK